MTDVSNVWQEPLVSRDFEDHLAKISKDKRELLVATYIAAATELGDTFYIDNEKDRQKAEAKIVYNAVESVNYHIYDLGKSAPIKILFENRELGEREKAVTVNPKSKLPTDLAEALIESYRGLTDARPATICEALSLSHN